MPRPPNCYFPKIGYRLPVSKLVMNVTRRGSPFTTDPILCRTVTFNPPSPALARPPAGGLHPGLALQAQLPPHQRLA